jgi:glycosyl transferase family 25
MKIFIISLTNATQRRAHISAQLERLGLEYEFFDACRGDNGYQPYFDDYDPDIYMLHSRRTALPGEIGCYASHKSLWQKSIDLQQPVVIIEDDAHLNDELPDALNTAAKIIDQCGFIRLEANKQTRHFYKPSRYQPVGYLENFEISYLSRIALCATAYIVAPAAAIKLVAASSILIAPNDKFMQQNWHHGQALYLMSPATVRAQDNELDSQIKVDTNSAKHALGFALFLKIAAYKSANWFRRVYFNATTGQQSRTRVREKIASLS